MPANLTPQYQKAEEEYRRAQTAEERVECLERMLQLIPKHKGTEKLQADLKTKLKEAKDESQTQKQAGKSGRTFRIPAQGAGTVLLVGGPNGGKSRVLAELTNAEASVADYPFATVEPLPGMMPWRDVQVQLIDTPPVTEGHIEPYVLNMVRAADAALLCFDGSSDDAPEQTAEAIQQFAERKTRLSTRSGFDEDDFSIVHVKTLMVVTRGDDPDCGERLELFRELVDVPFETLVVELDRDDSREELRDRVYELLDVIRVYTRKPGQPADMESPFTIPRGGTVEDVAYQVHRDLVDSLQHARVWGESAHDGQTVGKDHALCDGDVVELHA